MGMQLGTWGSYRKPAWQERLEDVSDYKIEKATGMSKEKLTKILQYLDDCNVIR